MIWSWGLYQYYASPSLCVCAWALVWHSPYVDVTIIAQLLAGKFKEATSHDRWESWHGILPALYFPVFRRWFPLPNTSFSQFYLWQVFKLPRPFSLLVEVLFILIWKIVYDQKNWNNFLATQKISILFSPSMIFVNLGYIFGLLMSFFWKYINSVWKFRLPKSGLLENCLWSASSRWGFAFVFFSGGLFKQWWSRWKSYFVHITGVVIVCQ